MMDEGHQRVDILMNVKVGDMVSVGQTIIARKPQSDSETGGNSDAEA